MNTMKCEGCLTQIGAEESFLRCSVAKCKKVYHREDVCSGTNALRVGDKWTCLMCRCANKKGGDNSCTPLRNQEQSENVTLRRGQVPTTSCELKSVTSLSLDASNGPEVLSELVSEIRLLRQDVSRLTARVDDLSSKQEDRIRELENRDLEIANLKMQVTELQEQLQYQTQASLRNELEIAGVPETSNENTTHLLTVIATKVGVNLQNADIDWTARAGPRNPASSEKRFPRPLVVRFTRRAIRDEVLKAGKTRRGLTTKDMELGPRESKIFINERLTRHNRLLFRDARKRAAAAGFKYCWTHNGDVFIRKTEGFQAIKLRTQADLQEKLGADPSLES